jgi:hypothetical protein
LSLAVTQLMKGVVYRDTHDRAWRSLAELQPQAQDFVEVLGLQVIIDEAEGYAFLRQRPGDPEDPDSHPGWSRGARFPFTSACCLPCCARSWPNSMLRAAAPGLC